MVYKYCENENFEDLASGRVIAQRAGFPNFPVRLAQEIFGRCCSYLETHDRICIYDIKTTRLIRKQGQSLKCA